MRTELMTAADTTAAKATITTMKGLGYSTEVGTYTKICSYGYAAWFTAMGTKYVSSTYLYTDTDKNVLKLYCDGGAQALAVSTAAAAAVVISMYWDAWFEFIINKKLILKKNNKFITKHKIQF